MGFVSTRCGMKFLLSKTNHLQTWALSHRRWSRGFDGRHSSSNPLPQVERFCPSRCTLAGRAALLTNLVPCRDKTRPSVLIENPAKFPNIPLLALTIFPVDKQIPVRANPVKLRNSILFRENSPGQNVQRSKRSPWAAIGASSTSRTSRASPAVISRPI